MEKFHPENGRPDKPVACPRCHSLNTKFCYFNNYNVKQPRHFCRECQRYWTAGGSLRNVPVGAGRRKHKISSSNPLNSYGNEPASGIGGGNECTHISSFKTYSPLPFKHLVACSPDGKGVPEDVMAMYGSEKLRSSETIQKVATDLVLDSKYSMVAHEHRPDTLTLHYDACGAKKLGFPQMAQKRARELTFNSKFLKMSHGHGPGTPKWTSTDDDAQDDVHNDVDDDAHDKGAPELPPSHCSVTHDTTTSCHMAEHDDSTCCSSVTAARASSSSEVASEPNGSSPTTHPLPLAAEPLGLENTPAFWGPLMWPWLWPFCFNRGDAAPVVRGITHVDPTGFSPVATNAVPQVDKGFTSAIGAVSASNAPHFDPAYASAVGPGLLHWPYVWNPLAWGPAWNAACITDIGIKHLQGPAQEKQGSLCIPKTLRMDRPDEAAHSSILSTLGVATRPHSSEGIFNAFQPKADVFQPKTVAVQAPAENPDLHQQPSAHINPAAQARSVAFQEGG